MVEKDQSSLLAVSGNNLLYNWLCFTKDVSLHSFLHKVDNIKRSNYNLKANVALLITPKLKSGYECIVGVRRKIKESEFLGEDAYQIMSMIIIESKACNHPQNQKAQPAKPMTYTVTLHFSHTQMTLFNFVSI